MASESLPLKWLHGCLIKCLVPAGVFEQTTELPDPDHFRCRHLLPLLCPSLVRGQSPDSPLCFLPNSWCGCQWHHLLFKNRCWQLVSWNLEQAWCMSRRGGGKKGNISPKKTRSSTMHRLQENWNTSYQTVVPHQEKKLRNFFIEKPLSFQPQHPTDCCQSKIIPQSSTNCFLVNLLVINTRRI